MRARLLLVAGALIAFGASLGSGFHFDDYAIFSDPALTSFRGFADLWNLRQTRPLTYLTFWLNYQVGGRDPLGYHVFNLLLHLGVVLLLFECLRRLLPERAAWLGAAIFAVHPIQAEAVDYIWGRSIMLAVLFCCASLMAWLDGRRWGAVFWFALALAAKEECVAFPLILPLIDGQWGQKAGGWRKRAGWVQIGAMLALAVAAGLRVIYALAVTPGAPAGMRAGISPWHYFLGQAVSIPRYLQLLVFPYGFTVDPAIPVPPAWLGVLVWAAIAAGAVWLWRAAEKSGNVPSVPAFLLAGVVLLMPSSSILPAADLAADRRLYLPLIAFAAAAGILLSRRKQAWLGTALVAALALVSVGRTYVWMSDVRLWSEAVSRAPGKIRPKIQLSRALPASQALEVLGQAALQAPYDAAVATETGRVFMEERQPDAALREFGRALAIEPRNAQNLNNRGVALEALGQSEAARMDFERALTIDPGLVEARENLKKLTGWAP